MAAALSAPFTNLSLSTRPEKLKCSSSSFSSSSTSLRSISGVTTARFSRPSQRLVSCAVESSSSSSLASSDAARRQRTAAVPVSAAASSAAGWTAEDLEIAEKTYPPFAAFKIHGTGRRKTAVARVGLIEGTGQIIINDLPLRDYFQGMALLIQTVRMPLSSLGYDTKYDVIIRAHGGGISAQAQAMVLGIARALVAANSSNRPPLKAQGMLTRDSRAVERKKYGLKKARKAPQFSKR
eukprot:TRINITY_DN5317_c0_g2_i2.p1 TRINITY_DN5317_c0_g2~~TRINITY_DN5317_c0_g2_i2.p1  ORF type:complete len:260 (+),score=57.87 TRINITY_DN5317_c0_g2_i2:69-782(+)